MPAHEELRGLLEVVGPDWCRDAKWCRRVAEYFLLFSPAAQTILNLSPETEALALAFKATRNGRGLRIVSDTPGPETNGLPRKGIVGNILVLSQILPDEARREAIVRTYRELGSRVIGFAAVCGRAWRESQPRCHPIFDEPAGG
jgi:hypothetical protein